MVSFIDGHREEYGVEPMCAVVPIGPSTYYENKAREADPTRAPPRARRRASGRESSCLGRDQSDQQHSPGAGAHSALNIAVFAENGDTILSVFNPAVYDRLFPQSRLSVQFRRWESDIRSILDEMRARVDS